VTTLLLDARMREPDPMLLTSTPPTQDPSERSVVGVLTVDDQAIFRSVACDVIEATPGFESLGEASSGAEAVVLAAELRPDLVLLDVRMPEMDGLETAARIHSAAPNATIVLLSTEEYEGTRSAGSCGACAFLRKQAFGPVALRALWADHGHRPA
jgi:two-component system, NarL family, invasion response regulator UvrY